MPDEALKTSSRATAGKTRFAQLLEQVRAGDESACENLVEEYGAVILREARLRLGSNYSSYLDAEDVVQSVLRSFLLRAREGRFDLREPAQLVRLLTQMARNKAFTAIRREGQRKAVIENDELAEVSDPRGAPVESIFARWELIEIYRQYMSSDEWQLLQWRLDGYTWPEIARRRQESSEKLRKRLRRVLDHLRKTLPIE